MGRRDTGCNKRCVVQQTSGDGVCARMCVCTRVCARASACVGVGACTRTHPPRGAPKIPAHEKEHRRHHKQKPRHDGESKRCAAPRPQQHDGTAHKGHQPLWGPSFPQTETGDTRTRCTQAQQQSPAPPSLRVRTRNCATQEAGRLSADHVRGSGGRVCLRARAKKKGGGGYP